MYGGSNLVLVIEKTGLQTMNNVSLYVALDRTMYWSLDYYKKNEIIRRIRFFFSSNKSYQTVCSLRAAANCLLLSVGVTFFSLSFASSNVCIPNNKDRPFLETLFSSADTFSCPWFPLYYRCKWDNEILLTH